MCLTDSKTVLQYKRTAIPIFNYLLQLTLKCFTFFFENRYLDLHTFGLPEILLCLKASDRIAQYKRKSKNVIF